ncbi:nucleotidyltransferase domain-containing protein [bacterium]|nr:nucleotidyltransferase domain-containing protein [bacterium]
MTQPIYRRNSQKQLQCQRPKNHPRNQTDLEFSSGGNHSFGSCSRGTADERGDVDILVVCPTNDKRRSLMLPQGQFTIGHRDDC